MSGRAEGTPRAVALGAVGLVLLGLAVRTYGLEAQSLWYDEGTSAALATRSLETIARNAADDIHPPLYYLLLAAWVRVLGDGVWALRALSALLGTVTVAGVIGLARRWWGAAAALAAGLAAVSSPYLVWYSQETRMYALGTALTVLLAHLTLDRADELTRSSPPSRARTAIGWVAYTLVATAALYTHYLVGAGALVVAGALALVALLGAWRSGATGHRMRAWLGQWLGANLVAAALLVPWLLLAWPTLRAWPAISQPVTLAGLLRDAAGVLALGLSGPADVGALAPVLIGVALLGLLARGRDGSRFGSAAALVVTLGPIALLWAVSQSRPAWHPKQLAAAAPGLELLLGAGLTTMLVAARRASGRWRTAVAPLAVRRVLLAAAVGAWLVVVLVPRAQVLHAVATNPTYQRDDYRGIVAALRDALGPRDAVIVNAPTQVEILEYYARGRLPLIPLPRTRPPDRARTVDRLASLADTHRDLYGVLWATDESDPEAIVAGWLSRHRYKVSERWHGNVRLAHWAAARQPLQPVGPDRPLGFGEALVLDAAAATAGPRAPGDVLTLWLDWRATGTPAHDYTVTVQLLDADGRRVAGRDMRPRGGLARTSAWSAGTTVRDRIGLALPPDLPPGDHRLVTALYDPQTGRRLPIGAPDRTDVIDGALELTTVVVR